MATALQNLIILWRTTGKRGHQMANPPDSLDCGGYVPD